MVEVMGTAPMSCPSFDLYQQTMFYLYQIIPLLSSQLFKIFYNIQLQYFSVCNMLFCNINQLLVDNNHAVRYHGQSKDEIAEEHIANRKILQLDVVKDFE